MNLRICFLLPALLMLGLQGCGDSTPPAPNTAVKSTPRPASSTSPRLNYAWPPTADEAQIILAPDLLAKNYYVIFDCSGSMSESKCALGSSKIEVARTALAKFATLVPNEANLGMLVFEASKIREVVPLTRGDRNAFYAAVKASQSSGGTPLFDAIKTGYLHLEEQGRKQLGYGDYNLVVVTDGEASSGQDPTEVVNWILDNTPVQIHTIGFCIDTRHSLNIPGRTVYKSAESPDQLQEGLTDVLAEAESFDVSDFNK